MVCEIAWISLSGVFIEVGWKDNILPLESVLRHRGMERQCREEWWSTTNDAIEVK